MCVERGGGGLEVIIIVVIVVVVGVVIGGGGGSGGGGHDAFFLISFAFLNRVNASDLLRPSRRMVSFLTFFEPYLAYTLYPAGAPIAMRLKRSLFHLTCHTVTVVRSLTFSDLVCLAGV